MIVSRNLIRRRFLSAAASSSEAGRPIANHVDSNATNQNVTNNGNNAGKSNAPLSSTEIRDRMDEVFRRPVPFMRWYRAMGVASALAACIYYYLDYRNDDEQLNATIRDLGAANPSAVDRALGKLDNLLVHEQRTFTGTSRIYTGADELVHRGAVEALLLAASQETVELSSRIRALDVLALLATTSCAARQRIAAADVTALCAMLEHTNYGGRAELLAGATLLATLRDVDARGTLLKQPCVGRSIESASTLAAKIGPVRLLLATELLHEYAKHAAVSNGVIVAPFLDEERTALDASLQKLITQPPQHDEEQLGKVVDALSVGVLGFVYGRVRWFVHVLFAGTGIPVRRVALEVAKRTRVGIWLGAIMLIDTGFTWVLRNWTTLRDEVSDSVRDDAAKLARWQPIANAPARLVVPSVGAVVVSTLLVSAIRQQRFMIVPLAVAVSLAHADIITPSQPWQFVVRQWKSLNAEEKKSE